ncbi:hypothetical protein NC652_036940 [Populus alba x Populus x berolinensis]|nr:hypothetical protein NC652_036940 [Populus alba x Populus x berolinensis]
MFCTFSHYLVRSRLIFSFVNDSVFFLPKRTMYSSLLIVEQKQQICIRLTKSSLVLMRMSSDTTKSLMSSPKCRSVEVINNSARPGSNHREVNCINYK